MAKKNKKYQRNFNELEAVASKFWPSEISQMEADISIVPLLIETQEQFINILSIDIFNIENLFNIIDASVLPANLFLKHLVILADFGGEMLQRISREFDLIFPDHQLKYYWKDQDYVYNFKSLPKPILSNKSLKIDGKELFKKYPLNENQKDAIALILFGSSIENPTFMSTLGKCQIGEYLGKPRELNDFIKQRYIWVSRIVTGAKSNNLGQIAQQFVAEYIKNNLNLDNITVSIGGCLPNVTHINSEVGRETSFDIIVTNQHKYVAIEVSFQVTTNSVIERKAGQAKSRHEQVILADHKIAYVIDGSGNFTRQSALETICSYSDCTVAFSESELNLLCHFLEDYLQ